MKRRHCEVNTQPKSYAIYCHTLQKECICIHCTMCPVRSLSLSLFLSVSLYHQLSDMALGFPSLPETTGKLTSEALSLYANDIAANVFGVSKPDGDSKPSLRSSLNQDSSARLICVHFLFPTLGFSPCSFAADVAVRVSTITDII